MPGRKSPTARDGFVRGAPTGGSVARRSLLLVVAAVVVGFLVVPLLGQNGLAAWFRLRGRERDLQAEVDRLEVQISVLEQRLDALASDPATLERLAREQYNMRRPEENVLLVIE